MANKFQENLNQEHGVSLIKFRFNGIEFDIRSTEHSIQRFKERGIDVDAALGSIVALGKERLYKFAELNDDVAIIDKEHNITVIITFEGSQIRIRTIIPKSNVFVKTGTRIFKLQDYKGGF